MRAAHTVGGNGAGDQKVRDRGRKAGDGGSRKKRVAEKVEEISAGAIPDESRQVLDAIGGDGAGDGCHRVGQDAERCGACHAFTKVRGFGESGGVCVRGHAERRQREEKLLHENASVLKNPDKAYQIGRKSPNGVFRAFRSKTQTVVAKSVCFPTRSLHTSRRDHRRRPCLMP